MELGEPLFEFLNTKKKIGRAQSKSMPS